MVLVDWVMYFPNGFSHKESKAEWKSEFVEQVIRTVAKSAQLKVSQWFCKKRNILCSHLQKIFGFLTAKLWNHRTFHFEWRNMLIKFGKNVKYSNLIFDFMPLFDNIIRNELNTFWQLSTWWSSKIASKSVEKRNIQNSSKNSNIFVCLSKLVQIGSNIRIKVVHKVSLWLENVCVCLSAKCRYRVEWNEPHSDQFVWAMHCTCWTRRISISFKSFPY